MKTKLLLCGAVGALVLSSVAVAQDAERPLNRLNREELREELRNLPPEERQARIRELREQFGQPGGPLERREFPAPGNPQAAMQGRVMMVLTPEQRESMRGNAEVNREDVRELEEKLRDARKEATEATLARDFNERVLRSKLEAAAKIETELAVLRAKALANIEPPLTEEQLEKIKNPAPMANPRLERRGPAFDGPPGERPPRDEFRPGRPQPRGPREGDTLHDGLR